MSGEFADGCEGGTGEDWIGEDVREHAGTVAKTRNATKMIFRCVFIFMEPSPFVTVSICKITVYSLCIILQSNSFKRKRFYSCPVLPQVLVRSLFSALAED
jgi:hypothetical protein